MKKQVIFFVGPEKTGTTFLHHFFNGVSPKEKFYLSRKRSLAKEIKRIESANQKNVYIFEPTYFASPFAIQAIVELKMMYEIVVVHTYRNSVDRSYSHFMHHYNKGRCYSLSDCIKKYPEIISSSAYEKLLPKWRENLKVVTFNINEHSLSELCEQLGIKVKISSFVDNELAYEPKNIAYSPKNKFIGKVVYFVWDALYAVGIAQHLNYQLKFYIKNFFFKPSFKNRDEELVKKFKKEIEQILAK